MLNKKAILNWIYEMGIEICSQINYDELDFYTDLLNMSFTLSDIQIYRTKDEYEYAKLFMEEHGLI